MNALLICPSDRLGVECLSQSQSLSVWPLLGTPLAAHWIEHLTGRGARRIKLITARRAEELRAVVGDGARWGVSVEVISESHELTPEEARAKHGPADEVFVADSLPEAPDRPLFTSYARFFGALEHAFFSLAGRGRVGAREIQPGVWAGLRTQVGADVVFEAPCWLGEDVHVDRDVRLGPWSILEDRVWVGAGAEVSGSIIGADTSLGVATSLRHSIAFGDNLIDWKTGSVAKVADSFLLCDLRATPFRQRIRRIFARLAEAATPEPAAVMPAPIRVR